MTATETDALATARALVDAAQGVIDAALRQGAEITEGGRAVDEHQVHVERLAYLATQVRAAHELAAYVERLAAAGKADALIESEALAYAAETAHALRSAVEAAWDDFSVGAAAEALYADPLRQAVRTGLGEGRMRAIGRQALAALGANHIELEDEVAMLTRDAAREFAKQEVAPRAQEIHRQDLLVPEDLIEKFSAQGFFGSSIPEQYGGTGMGDLSMVIITEELSAASLAAAGSLATRPEILSKALLAGAQRSSGANGCRRSRRGRCWSRSPSPSPTLAPTSPCSRRGRSRRSTRGDAAGASTARRHGAPSPGARKCWRCLRARTPTPPGGAAGSPCSW